MNEVEGYSLIVEFSPFKKIIYWIFLFLFPLLFIAFKNDVLNLIMDNMETFLSEPIKKFEKN